MDAEGGRQVRPHALADEDIAGRLMAADCTATWAQGSDVLTVSCPHGRLWFYPVIPIGDRPLPHFLHDLPWATVPGSEWALDDGEGTWSVRVVPRSSQDAAVLFAAGDDPVTAGLVDLAQRLH